MSALYGPLNRLFFRREKTIDSDALYNSTHFFYLTGYLAGMVD